MSDTMLSAAAIAAGIDVSSGVAIASDVAVARDRTFLCGMCMECAENWPDDAGTGDNEGCRHWPTPEIASKRRALQARLRDGVQVDATKLKDRTPRRSVEVLAHDIRRKLLERADDLLDHNDLDNAVTLINAAKGLV